MDETNIPLEGSLFHGEPLKASKGVTTAALVSPNVSQQSIWASQGRAAEGGITMVVRVVLVGIP